MFCDRSGSDSSSSSSDSSESSNAKRRKKKGKKGKGRREVIKPVVVQTAEAKAAKKSLEAFAKQAQKEVAKKKKEAERLRVKDIAMASAENTKVKKALASLTQTLQKPLICHVPSVTMDPLLKIVQEYEHRIKSLEQIVEGNAAWNPALANFSPKAGLEAQKPVIAILTAMKKFTTTT